jgi:VIT1/CCC1 family predicted Fe2+/Mn2+ transporter
MAASNFLGTRAEDQQRDRLRRIEEEHIDRIPDGEREEIRQIMQAQGFKDAELDRAVDIITADRRQWIEMMLKEEYGVPLAGPVAWKAATATFIAFLVIGLIPLLPFLLRLLTGSEVPAPYLWSTLMTGAAFFVVGAAKSRFVDQHWSWSGLETLTVGGGAAALAYVCGVLLKSVV